MMSACENASASRSGDAAPKTFNVKTLNVKRFRGDYSSLEDAVPLSLEYDIRTWKRYYLSRKQNEDRPSVEELPSSTVATLREQNALDLELYRFARNRFETELAENHPDLASTLRSFRRWNWIVQRLTSPLLPLYRTVRGAVASRK